MAFKKARHINPFTNKGDSRIVSNSWYTGFMKRNASQIASKEEESKILHKKRGAYTRRLSQCTIIYMTKWLQQKWQ